MVRPRNTFETKAMPFAQIGCGILMTGLLVAAGALALTEFKGAEVPPALGPAGLLLLIPAAGSLLYVEHLRNKYSMN